MTSESLILGKIDLVDYVSEPFELNEARKKEIDSLIGQLEKNALNVEQLPLKLLKIQRKGYKTLNPEFLSMGILTKENNRKVKSRAKVPRFAVYKRSNEGFDPFYISFSIHYVDSYYGGVKINKDSGLPSLFETNLIKSVDFYENAENKFPTKDYPINKDTGYHFKLSEDGKRLLEKFPRSWIWNFSTEFSGIIPSETKKKLNEADKIFGKDVYLIVETTPESWEETVTHADPLLTGVLGNKLYLIDHFNTTSIEEQIKVEFTE